VLRLRADVSLQHLRGVAQTLAKLGYGKETEDEYYKERKTRIVELQGRYERLSEYLAQYTDAARCAYKPCRRATIPLSSDLARRNSDPVYSHVLCCF